MKLFDIPELNVSSETQSDLLAEFLKSIQIRGDFPSSLTLLEKVYQIIDSGEASSTEISDMLRVDHVLALRLISLVNHEHYRPSKPIHSVSGAVDHLGLLRLKEVLPGLADAKNFNAIFLGHAAALSMMQQAILASVIAKNLGEQLVPGKDVSEFAYLTAVISNLGPLLLSFYQPQLYSVLTLSCHDDYSWFQKNFERYVGLSLGEFSENASKQLALPVELVSLASAIDLVPWEQLPRISGIKKSKEILIAVHAGNLLAHELCNFTGIQGVQRIIRLLENNAALPETISEKVLEDVANVYINHTETLFLKPVRLPEYLQWFAAEKTSDDEVKWQDRFPKINQRINPFLYDLRLCMKNASEKPDYPLFPQAIFLTLETLVKGLNFDRAVFFRIIDNETLKVGISIGVKIFQESKFAREIKSLDDLSRPDTTTIQKRQPCFEGSPIFPEGEPFAAFPVIWRDRVIGLFYADKIRKPNLLELSNQEKIACTALAEEWRDIPVNLF